MTTAGRVHRHQAWLLCVAPNPSVDRIVEVDRLEPGTIHRPRSVHATPGGKGLNAARAAAAIGTRVVAVGILAGHAGRWIAEALERAAVEGRFVWVEGETRTCTSVVDIGRTELTEFYEAGPHVSDADWSALVDLVDAELSRAPTVVTISGSLPLGVPAHGVATLVEAAQRRGIRSIIDTHGDVLRAALDARPWLIKVNAQEATAVVGAKAGDSDLSIARALAARAEFGAVVTSGRNGATAVTQEGAWRVRVPGSRGPYTVGSGDAFLAGLATGLSVGRSVRSALALAVATGTANTELPGAGNLNARTVEVVRSAVRVEPAHTSGEWPPTRSASSGQRRRRSSQVGSTRTHGEADVVIEERARRT